MELALLQNKPEFVELLLENGVNLNSFLKSRRLYYLYNSYIVTLYIRNFIISYFQIVFHLRLES